MNSARSYHKHTYICDFKQFFIFWTKFINSPQHKMSRISVQWQQSLSMQTDGQSLSEWLFSALKKNT